MSYWNKAVCAVCALAASASAANAATVMPGQAITANFTLSAPPINYSRIFAEIAFDNNRFDYGPANYRFSIVDGSGRVVFRESTSTSGGAMYFQYNTSASIVTSSFSILVDQVESEFRPGVINLRLYNSEDDSIFLQRVNPVDVNPRFPETPYSISAVPETSTWSMLLIGFGMVATGVRYRYRRSVVVFG